MDHEIRPNSRGYFPRVINGMHRLNLGNGAAFTVLVFKSNEQVTVGVFTSGNTRYGCYVFQYFWVSRHFVEEKLGLRGDDAANLADFINCQMGDTKSTPQGNYLKACTKEWEQS